MVIRSRLQCYRTQLSAEQTDAHTDKEKYHRSTHTPLADEKAHNHRHGKADKQDQIQIPHFFAPLIAVIVMPNTASDITSEKTPTSRLLSDDELAANAVIATYRISADILQFLVARQI